jgi:hypothetical protein
MSIVDRIVVIKHRMLAADPVASAAHGGAANDAPASMVNAVVAPQRPCRFLAFNGWRNDDDCTTDGPSGRRQSRAVRMASLNRHRRGTCNVGIRQTRHVITPETMIEQESHVSAAPLNAKPSTGCYRTGGHCVCGGRVIVSEFDNALNYLSLLATEPDNADAIEGVER